MYVDPSWHDAQSFLDDVKAVVIREQREEFERILNHGPPAKQNIH